MIRTKLNTKSDINIHFQQMKAYNKILESSKIMFCQHYKSSIMSTITLFQKTFKILFIMIKAFYT